MKHEYKSITINGHPDEALNKLAAEGWEVVGMDHSTYLLKREKLTVFHAQVTTSADSLTHRLETYE